MGRGLLRGLAATAALALAGALATVPAPPAAAAEEVYTPPASGVWEVDGRGWGHGIGMSQWGAQGAALQGLTAEQILDFYYPGTYRQDIGQDYPLRVRLLSLAGSTLTTGPVPGAALVVTDVASGTSVNAPVDARVVVTRTGGQFTLATDKAGVRNPLLIGGTATVGGPLLVNGSGGSEVWTFGSTGAGTRYFGEIRALATGAGSLEVVNHVPMEQYLRGVVPQESPPSWQPAALQAQAVAARTYALAVRSATGTADLCDTTQCQVYSGSATSTASGTVSAVTRATTDAAILTTARIARYYGGGPAFTQFSSTNGGYTKVGSKPYLVAKPDPYTGTAPGDTRTRWTNTLTVAKVQQSCPAGGTLQRMVLTRDGKGDLGGRILSARLECSTGTTTVTTPAFGLLSSWWRPTNSPVGPPEGTPVGNLEAIEGTTGGIHVKGWTIDPGTTAPLTVRVEYGGTVRTTTARLARPDVAVFFPAAGPNHGFDVTFPAGAGTQKVCVTAVNVGTGTDLAMGCADVAVPPGGPYGSLDSAAGAPGATGSGTSVVARGWAVDPDVPTQSVQVEVQVDGAVTGTVPADQSRGDVGAALPGFGDRHGYTATVPAAPGAHEVCIRVVNVPAGPAPTLGCRTVTVPGGSPRGNLETATAVPGGVQVSGWSVDPDTADPAYVWVEVAGQGRHLRAAVPRTDIGAAFPGYGTGHGFSDVIPVGGGTHSVCVTAVNSGAGANVSLGCRTVTVPGGSPVGNFESATSRPGQVEIRGWALDPDTAASVYLWVDVNGVGQHVRASATRTDIGAAFPGYGAAHGFSAVLPAAAGSARVCLTVVNSGAGVNTSLGCRTVSVPGGSPVGNFESATAAPGGVAIQGWALDPDTTASPYVWVEVSGRGQHVRATASRPDIGRAYPGYGTAFGIATTVPAAPGSHRVCLTVVDVGLGENRSLGCRSVVVP
jgi:SpoIID/LytB domain protein